MPYKVAAFYQFAALPDFRELRAPLRAICAELGLKGSVLLADEGINGTLAGAAGAIGHFIAQLRGAALFGGRFDNLELKFSQASTMPFQRLKVRLKKEIVTLGATGLDPVRQAGIYVEPADWNALIATPDTLVLDTRNAFEVAMGTFVGALDPASTALDNSGILSRVISIRPGIGRSRCSALAAFAAKRPAPICSHAGFRRSIISRAGFSDIWKACRKRKAAGAANALCSTTASHCAMDCWSVR
jgi:hypothetical protein